MVAPRGPIGEQVAVMLAGGIAALAGHVGHHAAIPVAHVENLPPACAVGLPQIGAAGGVDRVAVAGPLDRPQLPLAVPAWMRQREPVQLAPLPRHGILPDLLLDL